MSSCMFERDVAALEISTIEPTSSRASSCGATNSSSGTPPKKKNVRNSTYKHVPHSAKPQHVVKKRNARERKRVQNVNSAFSYLRRHIPYENRHKRLSKVKTLRIAIDYIQGLQTLITDHDRHDNSSMSPPINNRNNNNNNNNNNNMNKIISNVNVHENSIISRSIYNHPQVQQQLMEMKENSMQMIDKQPVCGGGGGGGCTSSSSDNSGGSVVISNQHSHHHMINNPHSYWPIPYCRSSYDQHTSHSSYLS